MSFPHRILFHGEKAGFEGGIERYMAATARILRANGFRVEGVFSDKGRDYRQFAENFDKILTPSAALATPCERYLIHKYPPLPEFEKIIEHFGSSVTAVAHDHDLYCPRRYRYTFWKRTNCTRKYNPFYCDLCSLAVSPRHWPDGSFWSLLRARCIDFSRRLELLRDAQVQMLVLSQFMRENLLLNGFAPEHIHVVPPVIELPVSIATGPRPEPMILSLGQLIRGKGVADLLHMLALLHQDYATEIVGDGPERARLEKSTDSLGLREKVRFENWCADGGEAFLNRARMAIYPFFWQEPFGLVGPEAMAHAVPVIAYDHGGVREYVIDSETGFLVPFGDTEKLAQCCATLLDDPERAAYMGEAGRRLVGERFSQERFLEGFKRCIS
ncbi:MAG: glycosyltransferase family 4 protein [Victivallaceae bacterium]|nr:glycosyltransferase family 4 protein [Victivallaceae bacterium]